MYVHCNSFSYNDFQKRQIEINVLKEELEDRNVKFQQLQEKYEELEHLHDSKYKKPSIASVGSQTDKVGIYIFAYVCT